MVFYRSWSLQVCWLAHRLGIGRFFLAQCNYRFSYLIHVCNHYVTFITFPGLWYLGKRRQTQSWYAWVECKFYWNGKGYIKFYIFVLTCTCSAFSSCKLYCVQCTMYVKVGITGYVTTQCMHVHVHVVCMCVYHTPPQISCFADGLFVFSGCFRSIGRSGFIWPWRWTFICHSYPSWRYSAVQGLLNLIVSHSYRHQAYVTVHTLSSQVKSSQI